MVKLDDINFIPYLKRSYEDEWEVSLFSQRSKLEHLIDHILEEHPEFEDLFDNLYDWQIAEYLVKRYSEYIEKIDQVDDYNGCGEKYQWYWIIWKDVPGWELGYIKFWRKVKKKE